MMRLDNSNPNSCCYTEDFFKKLRELANRPLYIHLWSCFGGSANKDAKALGDGSILVTHIEAKETSVSALIDDSLEVSLSRYFDKNLTPAQQFILDWQENYEAMTFNQVESDGKTIKFKSIRTPKEEEMATIINGIEKNHNIRNFLNKFFVQEGARFQKMFTKEDVTKQINEVSNLDDKAVNKLMVGILTHLCKTDKNINIGLFENFVNKLLSNGIDLNHSFTADNLNALHWAITKGKYDIVKLLVDKGADTNIPIQKGVPLLYFAIVKGRANIIKILAEAKTKLNIKNNAGATALHLAVVTERIDIVKILVEAGADLNIQDSYDNSTALHLAVERNNTQIIKILVEAGADLNIKDKNGLTPLNIAVNDRNTKIITLLESQSKKLDPQRKRKLDTATQPTAKKAKAEVPDNQVKFNPMLKNISLADIAPALEKLRGDDMKPIDSIPNVGQAVISKKKKYAISKLNRR